MAFRTVTTTAEGISNGMDIYQDDVLLTSYLYTVATNHVTLSARVQVVTDYAGISPTIAAIESFMRNTRGKFSPDHTVDTFRQVVRRTNSVVEIVLEQGSNKWAEATMDRGTKAITYAGRDALDLTWARFVRWVEVQVEFMELVKES